MSTRVYVPVTATGLAALVADGRLAGPLRAHAVTPALAEAWAAAGGGSDEEELELVALEAAADASWHARGPADPPRRHVVAADVPAVEGLLTNGVDPDDPSLVEVTADIPWKRIASAHVDTEDRTAGPDGGAPDDALAWFATQEIRDLL
ncbi:DUF6912 family protein [Nocardioides perillae]|uniref:Uncharacterized protein n=1 Tax=Nocardioides perillae TaxID=1119534 RepID=A0A7Y9UMZ7_9ACTN|nr:hypothetical protein [Nocardioides perillae]NYG56667.1 hypothetical protein [Nocardioides perillae]